MLRPPHALILSHVPGDAAPAWLAGFPRQRAFWFDQRQSAGRIRFVVNLRYGLLKGAKFGSQVILSALKNFGRWIKLVDKRHALKH
jgi:hypothetical protein